MRACEAFDSTVKAHVAKLQQAHRIEVLSYLDC